MTRWCINTVLISGPKEDLDKLVEAVKEGEEVFSFNKIVPYPDKYEKQDNIAMEQGKKRHEEYAKLIKEGLSVNEAHNKSLEKYPWITDGYNQGGSNWCRENWGTKWDAGNTSLSIVDLPYSIEYSFDTAWSPPAPVMLELSKMFPNVTIRLDYEEPGMQFYGTYECENGVVTVDSCLDMTPKTHPDWYKDYEDREEGEDATTRENENV